MRNILCLAVLAWLIFSVSACNANDVQYVSAPSRIEVLSKYNIDQKGNIWNYMETLDLLYQQDKNYLIYTDTALTGFRYYVKDNDGNVIDEGYHNWRGGFGFDVKDSILILEYGLSGSEWQCRYYDVSDGRVSRFFRKPLQTSKELVAYYRIWGEDNRISLIVQNMFEPSKYYKEFTRDFSSAVIRGHSTAEFIDDNRKLKITYWTNPNDREVTEVIDLT